MIGMIVGIVGAVLMVMLARWNRRLREREALKAAEAVAMPMTLSGHRHGVPFVGKRGRALYGIQEVPGEGWRYVALFPRCLGFDEIFGGASHLSRAQMVEVIESGGVTIMRTHVAVRLWNKHFDF
jgi:hypothetical protein